MICSIYSLKLGNLLLFLGIVKFHVTSMTDIESEVDAGDNISMKSSVSFSACSLLDNMVGQIRESMGVESHAPSTLTR
jgi:hypothetical protein